MIHDHEATKSIIRAGGFADQPALLALVASHDALYAEHCRLQAARSKGGSTPSEAKAAAARRNGRKYMGIKRQQQAAERGE